MMREGLRSIEHGGNQKRRSHIALNIPFHERPLTEIESNQAFRTLFRPIISLSLVFLLSPSRIRQISFSSSSSSFFFFGRLRG